MRFPITLPGVDGRAPSSLLLGLLVAVSACGQAPPRAEAPRFDSALVNEQKRRIAAFDSVVRTINTDPAYHLWQAALIAPNAKVGQQQAECEYGRLMYRYGIAADAAIRRMQDTLWRHADGALVTRFHQNVRGGALEADDKACGPPPPDRAPYWLREWFVYPLPTLPPSATDSTPRHS